MAEVSELNPVVIGNCMLYLGDCVDVLKTMQNDSIDLTVTSPPYDKLRRYGGHDWDFISVSHQLFRLTKNGGVVVWIVGDETRKFCETLTSFTQATYFVRDVGFNLLDTMIYKKRSYAPAYPTLRRYASVFEYMFVFSKGRPNTFNALTENKAQSSISGEVVSSFRQYDGSLKRVKTDRSKTTKKRTNVWEYLTGSHAGEDKDKFGHPATFPDGVARDHVLSWSNSGDTVLDPFMGSGTTGKICVELDRNFVGIEIHDPYFEIARNRIEKELLK